MNLQIHRDHDERKTNNRNIKIKNHVARNDKQKHLTSISNELKIILRNRNDAKKTTSKRQLLK